MLRALSSGFRTGSYQKRRVSSRTRISVMAILVLLVSSIVTLPIDRAWAGQTLEIPAAANGAEPAPMPSSTPGHGDPAPYTDNTPIQGMGSISDYMHQPGEPASATAGYPLQSGGGYAYNTPNDPRSNSSQLLTAALVGGAIIGLIALSNYSAHHHRNR